MPLEIKDGMVSFDMSNIGASTVKAKIIHGLMVFKGRFLMS